MFILQDVRAHLSCALSSYQIEPTARDSPQNDIGIEALEPHHFLHSWGGAGSLHRVGESEALGAESMHRVHGL